MFVATIISLLAVLDITTGQYQQQVPVCMPVTPSKSCEKDKTLDSTCPLITFHLPRDNQVSDYIRYRNYVPRMPRATVCAWIETTDFDDDITTIASYAVSDSKDNEYLLYFDGFTTVGLTMNNNDKEVTVPPLSNKFHICHTFSVDARTSSLYIDGNHITTFGIGSAVVEGGGVLILGQDQDDLARSFEADQALQGNITNFMIWPRVLTGSEINDLARHCQCPIDHSIVFSLDRVELFGQASYSIPETCPTL